MRLILLLTLLSGSAFAQRTQVDYPTQVKNGPIGSDGGASSLTAACTGAGSAGIAVTQRWLGLQTQTLPCNISMVAGGRIQPAAGQSVTITGTFNSPDTQTLDTSLAGAGSIAFTHTSPHAEWFGADPTGTADSTLAINSALYAAPLVGSTVSANALYLSSGGSQGVQRANRQAAATIGCGNFKISGTIYMNVGDRFAGTCTDSSTIITLAPNTFTGSEHFIVEMLINVVGPYLEPNFTQKVYIENIDFSGGGNNSGSSGIKWYGAETNSIKNVTVSGFGQRGIIVGDTNANDGSQIFSSISDSVHFDNVWIIGNGASTVGPCLYVHVGSGSSFQNVITQYCNSAGTYTSAVGDGQANPEVWIDASNQIAEFNGYGEADSRYMAVTNTQTSRFTTYGSRGGSSCASGTCPNGITISGNSFDNAWYGYSYGFTTALSDTTLGIPTTYAGSASATTNYNHNQTLTNFTRGVNVPSQNSVVGTFGLLNDSTFTATRTDAAGDGAPNSAVWKFYPGTFCGGGNPCATLFSNNTGGTSPLQYFLFSAYAGNSEILQLDPTGAGNTAVYGGFIAKKALTEVGHHLISGSVPTLTGSGCSAATGSLHDSGGIITTAGANSCVVTFSGSYGNPTISLTPLGGVSTTLGSVNNTAFTFSTSGATTVYYIVNGLIP